MNITIQAKNLILFLEKRMCVGKIDAGDKAVARPLFPAFQLEARSGILKSLAIDGPYGYIYGTVSCPADGEATFDMVDGVTLMQQLKREFSPSDEIILWEDSGILYLERESPRKVLEIPIIEDQWLINDSLPQFDFWGHYAHDKDSFYLEGNPFQWKFVPEMDEIKRLVKAIVSSGDLDLRLTLREGKLYALTGNEDRRSLITTRELPLRHAIIPRDIPETLIFEGLVPIWGNANMLTLWLYENTEGEFSMGMMDVEEDVTSYYLIPSK